MSTTVGLLFVLLVAYQVKHFLADYVLQGDYQLGKFRDDWGFFWPLLTHVAMHYFGTLVICAWAFGFPDPALASVGCSIALFDATVHFFMDRIKAGRRYLGRYKPLTAADYVRFRERSESHWTMLTDEEREEASQALYSNRMFWWSLGFDQMVHHLTHYACIYFILRALGKL